MNGKDDDLLVKIRFQYPSMTKSEKKIADLLLDNHEAVRTFSLTDCADAADCSEASVLRFCRKLGFNGFLELRQLLNNVDELAYNNGVNRICKNDSAKTIFQKIIWQYEKTLSDTFVLCDDQLDNVLHCLQKAKQVYFFGIGDAALVCQYAFMKLQRIGIPGAAFSDPALALAGASQLGPDDLAIGVSFSGETKLVVDSIRIAKQSGAMTACITHFTKSELIKYVDNVIYTATTDFTPGHDEIARRTAEFALIDTLYMGLVESKSEELYERRRRSIQAIIENKN